MKKLIFLLFVCGFSAQSQKKDYLNRYICFEKEFTTTASDGFFKQKPSVLTQKPESPSGMTAYKAKNLTISGKPAMDWLFWNEISAPGAKEVKIQLIQLTENATVYVDSKNRLYLSDCRFEKKGTYLYTQNRLKTADESHQMVIDFRKRLNKDDTEVITHNDGNGEKVEKKVKETTIATTSNSELEKAVIGLAGSTSNLNKVVADHEVRITGLESKVLTLEEKQAILERTVAKNKQEFYDYVDSQEDLSNRQKRQVRNDYDNYYSSGRYQSQSLPNYFGYGGQGYQNSNCQSFWGGNSFLSFSVSAGYSSYQPNTVLGSNYCYGQGGGYGNGGGYSTIYYNDYSVNNSNNTSGSYNKTNTNSGNSTSTTHNYPRGNEGGGKGKGNDPRPDNRNPPGNGGNSGTAYGKPRTQGNNPNRPWVNNNNGTTSYQEDKRVQWKNGVPVGTVNPPRTTNSGGGGNNSNPNRGNSGGNTNAGNGGGSTTNNGGNTNNGGGGNTGNAGGSGETAGGAAGWGTPKRGRYDGGNSQQSSNQGVSFTPRGGGYNNSPNANQNYNSGSGNSNARPNNNYGGGGSGSSARQSRGRRE